MFSFLQVMTEKACSAPALFIRNHFPNHTIKLTHFNKVRLQEFLNEMETKTERHKFNKKIGRQEEKFWRQFDPYYRVLCQDYAEFNRRAVVEISFYEHVKTSGVYVLTIREIKSRDIVFRASVRGLCTKESVARDEQRLEEYPTTIFWNE
jgi:hypothetical protein